ncbi:MAG: helix-turn-helix domain-containing protein [Thermoanaerobaculales bacterium]|nr:helix-turn-helix domain-containing protein [Thermoanaerobaculales bacterium]
MIPSPFGPPESLGWSFCGGQRPRKENSIPVGKDAAPESIGQRLARLRKSKGLTQDELATILGVTQPLVSSYERSELRLHGETIILLTQVLGVTADALLGLAGESREPQTAWTRRLAKKAREIEKLSKRDQDALMRTIDAYLSKAS